MLKIDAMGKACPIPVIETKKALKSEDGKNGVITLVDNEIATQNISKMAKQLGLTVEVKKISEKSFEVTVGGEGQNINLDEVEKFEPNCGIDAGYVVAISSDEMGGTDRELGTKLMNSFIYSLTEQDVLPKAIVCYNAGVKMTSENEKSIEDLKKLKDAGVEILSCGLCLNYYGLTEKLQVGEVTNMYRIVEILRSSNVVRP